ncbi:hypothetical protein Q9966_003306 [Columba livia]|nr:hypothetical protein Q9966_003306 [Columba livia]
MVFPAAAGFIWVVKFQMKVNYWRVEKLEFIQVAGKAEHMAENTSRGISWKMTALLVILTFMSTIRFPANVKHTTGEDMAY